MIVREERDCPMYIPSEYTELAKVLLSGGK